MKKYQIIMKKYQNLITIIFLLCFQQIQSQTIVWSEDFTSGSGNWELNVDGGTVIPGSTPADSPGNSWIVNNSYIGFYVSGFTPGNITYSPAPSGGGNYLHIHCVSSFCQNFISLGYYHNGPDFLADKNTNKVARLLNPIPGSTLSGGPYVLEFEWMCKGHPTSAYATLVYSINGGLWQEYSQQYQHGDSTWQTETINLSVLGWNPGDAFQFGFRWSSDNSGTGEIPSFSVDNIKIKEASNTPNTITTASINPTTYCAGANISVNFTSTGTFNAGNVYSLQMSDATGSFAAPSVIGTLASTANAGTISGTIPIATPAGNAYRFRVVSSNPSTIGTDNGQNISIQEAIQPNVVITSSSSTACVGQNIDFNSNVTGADNANITYQWYINGIPLGGNTPTFTTNTLQQGSTVKLVITAVGSCNTAIDTSNIIVMDGITVSCSTNTNTVFMNVVGGTPPYTYRVIDFGDGTSDSLTNVVTDSVAFTHNYSTSGTFNVQVSVTDSNGCSAISNCTLNNSTTSTISSTDFPLIIYPNPFNDFIHIHWQEPLTSMNGLQVKLMDSMGRTILTQEIFQSELEIDTNFLPKGVYFIQVKYNEKVFVFKIIK